MQLPEVLVGIQECSEEVVVWSLQSLAVLVPLLGADCVVGANRRHIFTHITPKVASAAASAKTANRARRGSSGGTGCFRTK